METVAIVKLATGSKHEITQETYEQILEAQPEEFILLANGTAFKKSAVMEIDSISNSQDYHAPYTALPAGNVYTRSNKNIKELMFKGYQKIKPNAKITDLGGFKSAKTYDPKYKTWEEIKAAGITFV